MAPSARKALLIFFIYYRINDSSTTSLDLEVLFHYLAENERSPSLTFQPPDLDDVRESVRQGVTKVAGKLSSLANGVMSSLQVSIWILFTIFS